MPLAEQIRETNIHKFASVIGGKLQCSFCAHSSSISDLSNIVNGPGFAEKKVSGGQTTNLDCRPVRSLLGANDPTSQPKIGSLTAVYTYGSTPLGSICKIYSFYASYRIHLSFPKAVSYGIVAARG